MEEEIVTIPNVITFGRLLLLPFFIITLVYNKVDIAILIFAAIALSDALDGLSARITKQKTRFGALFDTMLDWVVIISSLITFLLIKKYLSTGVIIALFIPMFGGLLLKGVYLKKLKKTTPTIIGKVTFAFAYVTVVVLLLNFAYKDIFIIITTALAYATMINYLIKDVKLFIR